MAIDETRLMPRNGRLTRRRLLVGAASLAAAHMAVAGTSSAAVVDRETREPLPRIGLGSWVTFNVGENASALAQCTRVVETFMRSGGLLIDSSPMYGSSQATIGHALQELGCAGRVFSADKVWSSSRADGIAQIAESRRRWGVEQFDLMQVHNLDAWEEHLPTLLAMKASGSLGYVGATTSEGRREELMERVLCTQPLDCVQLTYNIIDRDAERRLLPLARERGIGVICNRPFRRGELIARLQPHPLPGWAAELACTSWAQLLLKFIVSHPAVLCAIPATRNPLHVRENVLAGNPPLPNEVQRQRMIAYVGTL